ncbi:MauE/DoxX family redox-associated membrane protein [Sinomicrobium sp. M5D2P17]
MQVISRHRNVLAVLICLLFILLFVYAACTKLMEYEKFRVQLGQSPILTSIGSWLVWTVPAAELVIAGMLVVPRLRLMALYAAFSLMTMFTAYIFIILTYSPFVPCSCGGILEKMGWEEHLVFNSVFVLLALTGILLLSRKQPGVVTGNSEPLQAHHN